MDTQLARCDIPADWLADFSQCLYEWQTLAASGIAALMAVGTIYVLVTQLKNTEHLDRDRKIREERAARAGFPFTLDALGSYCQSVARELHRVWDANKGSSQRLKAKDFEIPPFPIHAVHEAKEVIAATDRRDVVALLTVIIRNAQSLKATISGFTDPVEMRSMASSRASLWDSIYLSARLYAMVDQLYSLTGDGDQTKKLIVTNKGVNLAMAIFRIDTNNAPSHMSDLFGISQESVIWCYTDD